MYKRISLLLLTGFLLSACGPSNLWGSYAAYLTPEAVSTSTLAPDPSASETASSTPRPATETPTPEPTATTTSLPLAISGTPRPMSVYTTQSGDTLAVIAKRYEVDLPEISSAVPLPASGLINPGTIVFVPNHLLETPTTLSERILPDSEVLYSPSTVAFNIQAYIDNAGGKLSIFREYMAFGWLTGAEGVLRMAQGSSMNPRLLLGLIQFYTGWVQGEPKPGVNNDYPLGYQDASYRGLYQQMRLMVRELEAGYYGWRTGDLVDLTFPDGTRLRLAPDLNAGSAALMYLFSQHMEYAEWLQAIDQKAGFPALYRSMFGDPWERAQLVEPLYPKNLIQPPFTLPFEPNTLWSLTGGPHAAWEAESALAALDFAPAMAKPGCEVESNAWVVAIAPGRIVRSEGGFVVLDLDGDGYEQTGWVVLYLHIATKDRIPAGTWVNANDRIGHPSCEGGTATGTHVHIARKYNGEWVAAGDPLPFVMSGWTAHFGSAPYKGTLTKGDKTVTASQTATHESNIIRSPDE
jgi:LasA protease